MLCEGCHRAISAWQLAFGPGAELPDEGLQKFESSGEAHALDAGGL